MSREVFEYVLVGGGLANGLIALALRARRPGSRIAMIEQGSELGGNHTWCFHRNDLLAGAESWVAPLVCYRWPGYRVLFPHLDRTIAREYAAITSRRFHEVVAASLRSVSGSKLFLETRALAVSERTVLLESGEELSAPVIIDARGTAGEPMRPQTAGFQKFLGLEVELSRPHGLDLPILMDATVDQTKGFRFVYTLPLSPSRLLVEDTYFHRSPRLIPDQVKLDIQQYLDRCGYPPGEVIREESGVLPMPWSGFLPVTAKGPLRAGYMGGWFHPGTGYSFPVACRLAASIAAQDPKRFRRQELVALVREHSRQARFCHFLNDFLFRWYPAQARRNIFERFYRLPVETIDRFFALRLNWLDRFRLLAGRPPKGISLRYRLQRREQP